MKVKKVKKGDEEDEDEDEDFTTVGKVGKAIQFTPESIFKNLQVVQENRGKKVRIVGTRPLLAVTLIQCATEHGSHGANPYP